MESSSDFRERIKGISDCMMKIHKLLLEDEMENREAATSKVIPPNERLNVLLNDPTMAWLRNMSQLMAYVDEIYFQKEPILERQVNAVEEKVLSLFSLNNESEFSYQYKSKLGTIPDLMIAHGKLKVAIKQLSTDRNTAQ